MSKLLDLLGGGLIKELGNVVDNLVTSKGEKEQLKQSMQAILEKADSEAQQQVTKRWDSDMKSDSFLSKNIRPLIIVYLTVIFTACAFFDGNIGGFNIEPTYIPIFQSLLVTVYGAYFVGRTWEKGKNIGNNKNK